MVDGDQHELVLATTSTYAASNLTQLHCKTELKWLDNLNPIGRPPDDSTVQLLSVARLDYGTSVEAPLKQGATTVARASDL